MDEARMSGNGRKKEKVMKEIGNPHHRAEEKDCDARIWRTT